MKTFHRTSPARSSRPRLLAIFLSLMVAASFSVAPSFSPRAAFAMQSATVKIHSIQGSGSVSPFAGQAVTTSGIVTAIKSDGFFIQEPDASIDSDPGTSEAVFVFTSTPPPLILAVGSVVEVTGTVNEFRPPSDPLSQPFTQIDNSPIVTAISSGDALPAPIVITPDDASPTGSVKQLEKYEGMRVRVAFFQVTAPTAGIINERDATASSNGVFYGIVKDLSRNVARPFREPGIPISDIIPAPVPPNVPRFDLNPELLRVDSDGQRGASVIEVETDAEILNLTGVLDFSARTFTILPDPGNYLIFPGTSASPVSPALPNEFSVASFNMQRFFDTTDDPQINDAVLTEAAFLGRLNKASLAIRKFLFLPDIIGVQEVENLATLQALADKINDDTLREFHFNPGYTAHLVEGNDPSGLDVGFLLKGTRLTLVSATQIGKEATFTNPNNGQQEILNDRPPLRLRVTVTSPASAAFSFTVIVNHLTSFSGIADANDGARVRAKRRAQAEFLANLLQSEQTNSDAPVIVVGGFNSFQFNDGYVNVIGTVKGTPTPADEVVLASSDLVNPDFINITDQASKHYSFVSDGSAETLDHILVSQNMISRTSGVEYAHLNADFPESLRNDTTRPERVSDHDIPVAFFELMPAANDLSITNMASPASVRTGEEVTHKIKITNNAENAASPVLAQDILAFGTMFVSVQTSHGTCSPPTIGGISPVRCQIEALAPGSTATITVVVKATLATQFPFTVTSQALATGVINGHISQVSASATTTILPTLVPDIDRASVEGKKLIVEGLNFQQGAVVEINGSKQKTKNDEQLSNLKLIAKKGGKKIDPGETVTLTVLNPDGVRSAGFPFTRPAR